MFRRTTATIFAIVSVAGIFSVQADEKMAPENRVAVVEKHVAKMNASLKHLFEEVGKARRDNDLRRINCLTIKLNLIKSLLKASEQAKVVLMESTYNGDVKTADAYHSKIGTYRLSVDEIEKSLRECLGVEATGEEGVTMVYIRPDGEGDLVAQSESDSPLVVGDGVGDERYPVVPPASPFR